jgi:hypothetical protein
MMTICHSRLIEQPGPLSGNQGAAFRAAPLAFSGISPAAQAAAPSEPGRRPRPSRCLSGPGGAGPRAAKRITQQPGNHRFERQTRA